MDILAILDKIPVVGDISGLIQGIVGATDKTTGMLDGIADFVTNLNVVIDKIPKINIDFVELNGFFDAITNLFS